MSKQFVRVMSICAISTAAVGGGYTAAAGISLGDGEQIPSAVNVVATVTICSAIVLGVAAWLIDSSGRISAERDIRPIVRAEIERALERARPVIVSEVLHDMTALVDSRVVRFTDAGVARTAARMQEIVTGRVMADVLSEAVERAHRSGMIMQAQAAVPPRGVAPVVQMRTVTTGDN